MACGAHFDWLAAQGAMREVMEIMPILSALRRNRLGALLVAVQIALTLAVVANALAVIGRHWTDMTRPSGVDEANVFSMANQWVGRADDLGPRIKADLAALRALPGVVDVEATNTFPLSGNFFIGDIRLKPNQTLASVQTSLYFNTTHGLTTLGLRLVSGRWFTSEEVGEVNMNQVKTDPSSVVLTAALPQRLFPDGHPLGRSVYVANESPARVVGIVDRASSSSGGTFGDADFSTIMPFQVISNFIVYVVRTQPGSQSAVMASAKPTLLRLSRMRVINRIQTFAESRRNLFAVQAATIWLLATVCTLLLLITACGTVGLTMLWVAQRRRQIGMRRALGARRVDILRYFHAENLLIAGGGALLGIAAGLGANLWLARHLAVTRMSPAYICFGALVVLILSQLAVLWPAIRASAVPPSLAARGL
jgi:putative ABC transport system permease protein